MFERRYSSSSVLCAFVVVVVVWLSLAPHLCKTRAGAGDETQGAEEGPAPTPSQVRIGWKSKQKECVVQTECRKDTHLASPIHIYWKCVLCIVSEYIIDCGPPHIDYINRGIDAKEEELGEIVLEEPRSRWT